MLCGRDAVRVDLEFDDMFDGMVYARNFYDNQGCRQGGGSRKVNLDMRYDSCGVVEDNNVRKC